MNNFNKTYKLLEAKFKDLDINVPLATVPMFKIFADKKWWDNKGNRFLWASVEEYVLECFNEARNEILSIGFRAMKANVVFRPVKEDIRLGNDRSEKTVGYAIGDPNKKKQLPGKRYETRHMGLGTHNLVNIAYDPEEYVGDFKNTIVHEWAHLWMYNNGRDFIKAVKEYYDLIYYANEDKIVALNYKGDFDKAIAEFVKDIVQSTNYKVHNNAFNIRGGLREDLNDLVKGMDVNSVSSARRNAEQVIFSKMVELAKIKATPDVVKKVLFDTVHKELDLKNTLERIKKDDIIPNMPKKTLDKHLKELGVWVNEYGMKNSSEPWATGIEHFLELHPLHQGKILELMGN